MKSEKKESGAHRTGRDTSPAATRRDDHPAKAKERKHRQSLIDDQRVVADTLGTGSFPQHSTAAKQEGKAVKEKK